MYRSSSKRILSNSPRSMIPGGTSGVPTAPSRMASNVRNSSSVVVGEDLAVAEVARPAEVEVGRVDVDAGGADHLHRLGRHLGPDPVAADHCDAMRHRASHRMRLVRPERSTARYAMDAPAVAGSPVPCAAYGSGPSSDTECARPPPEEFDDLTGRGRIEVAEKIERAREMGDLSENGDYQAAKDEQGHMEGRIRQLEAILENCEIVDVVDDGTVKPGSVVTIVYEGDGRDQGERYLIGSLEEQPDDYELMSPNSPLGQALIGARSATSVSYETPTGRRR